MPQQPYINTYEDPALKKATISEIKNTSIPNVGLRPVKTTSTTVDDATVASRPAKTELDSAVGSAINVNTSDSVERIVKTPDGTIVIVNTNKEVTVNTYEDISEQKFINNVSGGILAVGTVTGTTYLNEVSNVNKLGFNVGGGFSITDLGNGTASVGLTGSSVLEDNVEVIGTSVGAVDAGYTFPIGMTFTQFVMAISQKTIPPTYTPPTLSLAGSPTVGQFEIGTITNILFTRTFTQNDAGSQTANRLYKNAVLISSSFPYTDNSVQLTGSTISYQAQVDYAQGPIKNDNMGNPSPAGRINAGTISSNTLSYVGIRRSFYGTPLTTPTTSNDVRAMSGSSFNTANNPDVNASGENLVPSPTPNYTITIPIGATRVTFAYPDTSRSVASVRYQELAFSEVKSNFTQTTVSVAGANSYLPVSYRVYTYVPVEPFSQEVHYLVFI